MAKTWDGVTAIKPSAQPKPGCCGPVKDRISLIKQVGQGLYDGHMGIAALYDSVAAESEDKAEKKQFKEIAARHRTMAEESLKIMIPDNIEEAET